MMRFHTQTAGVSLTAQQPLINIVRTTIEALAGVLGGTQSLHTNSYDEALALPTEEAVRVALRTQQVIAHESGVTNTVDPLGGSYFVETLTDQMEAAAYDYFAPHRRARRDGRGDQERLPAARDRRRRLRATSARSTRASGSWWASTPFRLDDEHDPEIHRPDPAAERRQSTASPRPARRATTPRWRRPGRGWPGRRRGREPDAALIAAARARVSEGEMVAALQEVFGTFTEHPQF